LREGEGDQRRYNEEERYDRCSVEEEEKRDGFDVSRVVRERGGSKVDANLLELLRNGFSSPACHPEEQ